MISHQNTNSRYLSKVSYFSVEEGQAVGEVDGGLGARPLGGVVKVQQHPALQRNQASCGKSLSVIRKRFSF